jgi:hypothetical protein
MGSAVDFMAVVTDPRDLSVRLASAARELSLVSHNERWFASLIPIKMKLIMLGKFPKNT